jgi:large subunit ribosomal protein L13
MNSLNKTFLPTQSYKNRNWFIIDCKDQKLGRIATVIATLLKGKVKPYYLPSIDTGDYVILINAESILINESATHHIVNKPGQPGSALKIRNVSDCLPKFTIERAVKGMLTQSEKKRVMRRLRIFNDENHTHVAQNPIKVDVSNFYKDSTINAKLVELPN